jgi:SM-20-related protein
MPQGIADDLARSGISTRDAFLPIDLAAALASECRALSAAGALTEAGVGRGATPVLQSGIRGDRVSWLSSGQSPACDRYLAIMDALRITLNRALYLGLEEYECHFALYAPGTSYSRHRDRFRDDDTRVVSVVVYLNDRWLPAHGGELRLHPEGESIQDISPAGGRLALFMSAEMPHEVLPASRDRLSLAGWFRRRS